MNHRTPLLPIITLLALSGCVDGDPGEGTADRPAVDAVDPVADGPDVSQLRGELCDTLRNSFECARAIEARQLPRLDRVRRVGDTLSLSLSGGDTVRLVDRSDSPAEVESFSYQGHWSGEGYFLVHIQYYEGSSFLLVDDDTGHRTSLADAPLRSPDGRRFAVLSLDLEAGYVPNTLQVWELGDGVPVLEWALEPEEWGPTEGRWEGAGAIRFTQRGYCEALDLEGGYMCDRPARLVLRDGGWRVETGGGTDDADESG